MPENLIHLPGGKTIMVRAARKNRYTDQRDHPFNHFVGRDEETGLIRVPTYASREDDIFMRVITRGAIGNIGIAPVIDPQLSALVSRRQAMAQTWEAIIESPFEAPARQLHDVMSQADDGQGAAAFSADVVGGLDVDNAGVFIAELPIGTMPYQDWESVGMELRVIDEKKKTYYLETNDKAGSSRGLWSLDGLRCSPTGNNQWPFWIYPLDKETGKPGKIKVLIPNSVGFQVVQRVGPKWESYDGFGQSGTWRYIGLMVHDQLIREMDVEAFLAQPPRGFVVARPVDQYGQLKQAIQQSQAERDEEGILYYPGTTFLEFMNSAGDVLIRPWSEPPANFTPQSWRVYREDVLAASFHVSVAFLVTRIGTGAFSQSDVTAEIQAETGLAWIRHVLQMVFSAVAATRRTKVFIIVPSDRAKKIQMEVAEKFANTLDTLQTAGAGLMPDQIQAMFQSYVGIEIPETEMAAEEPAEDTDEGQQEDEEEAGQGDGTENAVAAFSSNGHGELV